MYLNKKTLDKMQDDLKIRKDKAVEIRKEFIDYCKKLGKKNSYYETIKSLIIEMKNNAEKITWYSMSNLRTVLLDRYYANLEIIEKLDENIKAINFYFEKAIHEKHLEIIESMRKKAIENKVNTWDEVSEKLDDCPMKDLCDNHTVYARIFLNSSEIEELLQSLEEKLEATEKFNSVVPFGQYETDTMANLINALDRTNDYFNFTKTETNEILEVVNERLDYLFDVHVTRGTCLSGNDIDDKSYHDCLRIKGKLIEIDNKNFIEKAKLKGGF